MSTMLVMRYSEKLAMLCDAKGWGPTDLWRAIGKCVSRSTVHNWFNGLSRPQKPEHALKVARALSVSLDELADDEAEIAPVNSASGYELKVREIAEREGWDWLYWRVIEAVKVVEVPVIAMDGGGTTDRTAVPEPSLPGVNFDPRHRNVDHTGADVTPRHDPGATGKTRRRS